MSMEKTKLKSMHDEHETKSCLFRWQTGNYAYGVSLQTVVALARRGTLK
jgi:hypothetical protein